MSTKLVSLGALALVASLALPACPLKRGSTSSSGGPDAPKTGSGSSGSTEGIPIQNVATVATGHPRLLVRESDLPRLKSWANASNPIFENGLKPLIEQCVQNMDSGAVYKDDVGSPGGYTASPPEAYAMLFAFYSLIAPTKAEQDAYAKRAKTLLMKVMEQAAKGPADDKPFRDKRFAIYDRSRWFGMGFPLTVDWIYGSLSASEKKTIRDVFLRWATEIQTAETTTDNHPEPMGVVNDKKLLADPKKVRWAGNNYYTAHARNLGMMAMSFDAADDPNEKLRSYLGSVMGSWLYVSDALMRGDMRGGLAAEGFEYSPLSVGYIAQLLLAIHTAGRADANAYGKQVAFDQNPFWNDTIPAFLHSLSPSASVRQNEEVSFLGPLHHVAWFGDGEKYFAPDFMDVFGPMAVYDYNTGNAKRLAQLRWIETHYAPGGAEKLETRAGDHNDLLASIFYFMSFDPKGPPAVDPRPTTSTIFFSEGLGRFLQRTSWAESATWFTFKLGWVTLDHQHADAGMFELWRKGEWLTKERTGYGDDIACTDQKNGVALQNDRPFHHDGYRGSEWKRGSQWTYVMDGDPKLLASRWGNDFSYFAGDTTPIYNSKEENAQDIVHASRAIVWLVPDRIVVFDRGQSKKDKRFKRFWMQLPAQGTVTGNLMSMRSEGGQNLYVRSLLPNPGNVTVEKAESLEDSNGKQPALLDPIKYRLRVEAPGSPKSVRWLHVIQGADGTKKADDATLVTSTAGTSMAGAAFNDTVVMFPTDLVPITSVTYTAPPNTKAHLVTGLTPNAGYKVVQKGSEVTVTPGGDTKADRGGVLVIGKLPAN